MAMVRLDTVGLKCPEPILKIAAASADIQEGNTLEVLADCPTFEQDVRQWCKRVKKTLLWLREEEDSRKRCQIQF